MRRQDETNSGEGGVRRWLAGCREDVLTLGDKVTVICLGKDKMGRISFSMKDVPENN